MENKKLISTYEFTVYNCVVEIITEMLYLYLIYFVYQKSKEIFAYFIRFGKSLCIHSANTSNLAIRIINYIFSCIIFTLGILSFYFILIYFFDLSSIIHLKTKLFTIWKHLFRSDSNLTDLNSFFDNYCDSSGTEAVNGQNNKYFSESITYLCGWNLVDTLFIEQTLMQIIFVTSVILVLIKEGNGTDVRHVNSVNNNNNESSDSNRFNVSLTYYLDIISFILDQIVKIFFYFQCIYFIIVLICMFNNYRNMRSLHTLHNNTQDSNYHNDESLLNQFTSTYNSSNESSNELHYTTLSQDEEEEDNPSDYSKITFNTIITIIVEIIQLIF